MSKTLTIKLSERSPVRVNASDWPVIARADRHDGQVKCQANNEWAIIVREHADGRRLVYGWHEAGDGGQYAGFRPSYGGFLLAPGDEAEAETIRAIRRVAGVIGDDDLGSECVGELPAVVI